MTVASVLSIRSEVMDPPSNSLDAPPSRSEALLDRGGRAPNYGIEAPPNQRWGPLHPSENAEYFQVFNLAQAMLA